jgi:predicted nucleic acid-binding Zn ribbon protein
MDNQKLRKYQARIILLSIGAFLMVALLLFLFFYY